MRQSVAQQVADYRGVIGWDSFLRTSDSASVPGVEIPLYIKDFPIASRKPKPTEVNSVSQRDPGSGYEIGVSVLFWGTPDLLNVQFSGWIITPQSAGVWAPVDNTGTPLALGNVNYADIITMYLEGLMDPTTGGKPQRKNPDYFITPYGQKYLSPSVALWEPQMQTIMKKQAFTMQLYLEK